MYSYKGWIIHQYVLHFLHGLLLYDLWAAFCMPNEHVQVHWSTAASSAPNTCIKLLTEKEVKNV